MKRYAALKVRRFRKKYITEPLNKSNHHLARTSEDVREVL